MLRLAGDSSRLCAFAESLFLGGPVVRSLRSRLMPLAGLGVGYVVSHFADATLVEDIRQRQITRAYE